MANVGGSCLLSSLRCLHRPFFTFIVYSHVYIICLVGLSGRAILVCGESGSRVWVCGDRTVEKKRDGQKVRPGADWIVDGGGRGCAS